MASEELRKKWGTIFMGEREATVEQLDAMQEPMRREQLRREQQEDYLERVRAKAAERAREILGAAYAERQKVLEEARAEAEAERQKLIRQGEALKAAGTAAHEQAAAELARAEAARQEAERIREAAHGEGFQAGMEQAGAELKEFRAELGQSLAVVLRAVDAQRNAICDSWRGELVELVRTAVAAGTGWLLDKEHDAVLRSLVLEALNLLEDRATVTVRVNPEDEATVGDMFMAARERVPELKQWIVNGDAADLLEVKADQVKDAKTLDALKTALDVEAPEYEGCVADGKDGLETAIDELDDAAAWYEKHAGSLKKAVDAVNDSKLAKTIDTAKTLLESSNGNVQDDKTREELSKAIEAKDEAAIAKASKAVNDSIAAKQKADEEAKAKAQAEADAKAAAAANAQTQQQQYNYQQSQPQQSWTPSYPYGGGSTGGGSGTTSGGSGPAAASAPKPNLNGAYGCGNSCTGKDDGYYHH